jgi:hypothetical protein
MQLLFVSFLLAVLAGPIWAVSISVSASCNANPPTGSSTITQSGPNSVECESPAGLMPPMASSQASASFSLLANGFTVSIQTSAFGQQPAMAPNPIADANASITASLEALGPLRPGIVEISSPIHFPFSDDLGLSQSQSTFSFGTIDGTCIAPTCIEPATVQTIELGEPIELQASASVTATSTIFDGEGDAGNSMIYTLRFFETDGVTPVAVTEAPESCTFLPIGLGLLLLGALRRLHVTV